MDRAEEKCFTMWKTVLNCENNEVVKHFFGEVIWFDETLLEKAFEEDIFEILDNIVYDGNIENSAESFAKALKEKLLKLMRER